MHCHGHLIFWKKKDTSLSYYKYFILRYNKGRLKPDLYYSSAESDLKQPLSFPYS